MSLDARTHLIPDVAPVPISHWIDLLPHNYSEDSIPELSPEPTSLFLDLHPEQPPVPIDAQERPPEPLPQTPEQRPVQTVDNISPRTLSISLDERRAQYVQEVPPVPTSHWIDLFPVDHGKAFIPEASPEPASRFLGLHLAQTANQEAEGTPLALATEPPVAISDDTALSLKTAPIASSGLDPIVEAVTASRQSVDVPKRRQRAITYRCEYRDCMPDGTRYEATSEADMVRHYEKDHAQD